MSGDSALDHVRVEQRLGVPFPSVNYLTHIDLSRSLAYVETPKVACTSIKKFMMDQVVEGGFELKNKNQVHNRETSPLTQLRELSTEAALDVWSPKFRRFSFVRNPFSRLLSGYLDKLITNAYERKRHLPMMGFEPDAKPTLIEFLERLAEKKDMERDIHFRTQSALLMVGVVDYDFIGRFEGFAQDFLWLQHAYFQVDAPRETYESFGKHHASHANSKIGQFFGERESELVRAIYANDFEHFEYPREASRASEVRYPVRVAYLGKGTRS